VNPSISEVAQERTFTQPNPGGGLGGATTTTLPVVDRRDLDTVVRIRSGETLVLAGIIRTRETVNNAGVPWLRQVPLLGSLFSRKTRSLARTELAIFISPTLMEDSSQIGTARDNTERRLDSAGAPVRPPDPAPAAPYQLP
jgi:general secretion pathway protein D